MDEKEVTEILLTPEFMSAMGAILTLVVGSFATVINRQMATMNKRIVVLESDIEERDDELRVKSKALIDNQSLLYNVQQMYNQSLQQITELNNSTRISNAEIAKLQKELKDVNNIILDQQNQIKRYIEEITRLQPFEQLAHEKNGEVAKLTERLNELERRYNIEIAKREGAIEALKALGELHILEQATRVNTPDEITETTKSQSTQERG
jgi:chromosome segregation ATPase